MCSVVQLHSHKQKNADTLRNFNIRQSWYFFHILTDLSFIPIIIFSQLAPYIACTILNLVQLSNF